MQLDASHAWSSLKELRSAEQRSRGTDVNKKKLQQSKALLLLPDLVDEVALLEPALEVLDHGVLHLKARLLG